MSQTHKRKKEFYDDGDYWDEDFEEVVSKKDKKRERDERRKQKRTFDSWDDDYRS